MDTHKLSTGSWSYDENDRLQASPTTSYQYDQAKNRGQITVFAKIVDTIRLSKEEFGHMLGETSIDNGSVMVCAQ